MKTKINDYYIDLCSVMAIGPLTAGEPAYTRENNQRRFGCMVYMPGNITLWINVVPDVLDIHSIDTAHNDAIKAKAKMAYEAFVAEWKAVP